MLFRSQAEDGIRDHCVTGVQTCALPISLFVGRQKSINALEAAMDQSKEIILVAQKSAKTNDPGPEDLHTIGTRASIIQLLRLPDGDRKSVV